MARIAKKEKALTPEEKLAQALVPDVEQPYRVPENWCWGYLTASFAECKDSYRKPINATERAGRIGSIPYYGATGQVGWIDDYLTDEELVLLGEDGAPFLDLIKDKAYLISGKAWVNNHAHILKSFFGHAGNLYLLHYLNAFNYTGYVNGTTRLKLTQSSMDTMPVPIAPFAEQQRIVDRIESLFAKLDEAKEKAQAVVDGFEDRRAAILHKAFTGELTAEWRKENGISIESWSSQSLKESCTIGSGGTPSRKSPNYYNGDIPWVKTGEIDWNDIYNTEEHISLIATNNSSAKVYSEGAVLVAMYGMGVTRGRAAILKVKAATNQAVCVLQPKEYLINRYLFYYFMCNYWDIREQAVGGNQLNLSGTIISKFIINIPSVDEQSEIITILDSLFEKEQRIKEAAEQVIDQIDTIKKSILSRAFRGELGTNDPTDESAVELLKRVLRDDVPAPQRAKPVTIPKELSKSLRNDMEKKIIKLYFQRDTTALSVKEIMSVSSKSFEVLDCLRSLQNRQIITKQEDGNYRLMG